MLNEKIIHIIVGLGDGGAEATLFKLISNDKSNNHIVISLTDYGKYGKQFLNLNIPVYALRFKKKSFNLIKIFKLLEIVKKYNPKIIQSWMYHADFLTVILKIFLPKIKFIWGVRNTVFTFKDSYLRWSFLKICSILSHFVPSIIISNSRKGITDHVIAGYKKNKFRLIYNGVDIKKFHIKESVNAKKKLKIFNLKNQNKPLIGMVARYDKQKGYEILLKSLETLKKKKIDFNCFLIGKNIDYKNSELNFLIQKYNLKSNMFLLGQINNLENIYNALDIFVLSSINGEGFPNVLIEAMACGVPCVATNVGDCKFIINNTGWIVPPNNSKILSQALENAIEQLSLPKWLLKKKNCRNRVIKNFNINKMVLKFQKAWISLR